MVLMCKPLPAVGVTSQILMGKLIAEILLPSLFVVHISDGHHNALVPLRGFSDGLFVNSGHHIDLVEFPSKSRGLGTGGEFIPASAFGPHVPRLGSSPYDRW